MKLAAVVITKNEERDLDRCLQSLHFCHEIIVVDAESSDSTKQIALRHTKKFFVRPWTNYSEQKNYANTLTECDWILSVDADEEIPLALQQEIEELLREKNAKDCYLVARKTYHSGRWIRYGGWYPNRLVRLFRKSRGEWQGDTLHEQWVTAGTTGQLREALIHYSFDSISDQVERNNRYSSLGALQLRQTGKRASLVKICWKPLSKFLETYVIKRGFLDGFPGFFISISAAYSVFLKWSKLRELDETQG